MVVGGVDSTSPKGVSIYGIAEENSGAFEA